jgi:glycosyltransferase involved in cell wall biosynthesis
MPDGFMERRRTGGMTFALVIPTLNEVNGLRAVLPKIDRTLFAEIFVVDGGSTDGSVDVCTAHGLHVLTQPGRGLPDAETHAFRHLTADAMILFTPDGNSLPELLPELCAALAEGCDLVVASRYRGGARSDDDDALTGFGNRVFTALVNLLFRARFTDVMVGLRGYRSDAIRAMNLPGMTEEFWLRRRWFYMNSWELGSSIRAARLGLRVVEIPGIEPARIGGVRKLSILRNGLGGLLQIVHDFVRFPRSGAPR